MPRIIIPYPLRKYANNQREVTVDGGNVQEAMDRLFQKYPGFKTINDELGLVSIFINGRLARTGTDEWDDLSLNDEDEVTLIIPIAGG
ncbi:MAG: MoaD/ThiS family protein [Desulfobacterales bacterium]|nr:MAG: MoaD/ThiS family protein [Desulfobacterales bacterium]